MNGQARHGDQAEDPPELSEIIGRIVAELDPDGGGFITAEAAERLIAPEIRRSARRRRRDSSPRAAIQNRRPRAGRGPNRHSIGHAGTQTASQ
jgi:hypothetical protein